MRAVILGKGLLGSEFQNYFINNKEIFSSVKILGREDFDIIDEKTVIEKVTKLNPDIIINCVAYTDVDGAQDNKDIAKKVNGNSLKTLSKISNKINATLIHYSTDYIFNGKKKQGYSERSRTFDPLNEYGKSKLQGEKYVRTTKKFYLIRTSWLFGHHGHNFIETVLKLTRTSPQFSIVNDEYGLPTFAKDLVNSTISLIEQKKPYGIYHITNSGTPTSWHDYAKFIIQNTDPKNLKKMSPITNKEYGAKATRPNYSILLNTKLKPLPSWKKRVKEYLAAK